VCPRHGPFSEGWQNNFSRRPTVGKFHFNDIETKKKNFLKESSQQTTTNFKIQGWPRSFFFRHLWKSLTITNMPGHVPGIPRVVSRISQICL